MSDGELLDACRAGDTAAFAVVWERHHRAGLVAARNIVPGLDSGDLVSESYLRIFELVKDGRGPQGAFRPYLYQVIRSVASAWLRTPETTSDRLDEFPDPTDAAPWDDATFDLGAAAEAFGSLNSRWQAVLWYTEVEGLPPREVAKLIGISANGVSALAARARDGLQSAWVEAHIVRSPSGAACQKTLQNLQRYQRGKLTAALTREVDAHLAECESCRKAAEEHSTLNQKLALVLASIFVGSGAAIPLLGGFGQALPASAVAAAVGGGGTPGGSSAAPSPLSGAGAGSGVGVGGGAAATAVIATAAVAAVAVAIVGSMLLNPAVDETAASPVTAEGPTEPSTLTPKADVDSNAQEEDPAADESPQGSLFVAYPPVPAAAGVAGPGGKTEPPAPDPKTPPDPSDPSLLPGFACASPIDGPGSVNLTGTANEYGVIMARITQAPNPVPVQIIGLGTVDDGRGNLFHDIYTGTDFPEPHWWWGPSLTPLSQWPGLTDGAVQDVLIELQLVTPDGRFSPWTPVSPTTC